MSRKERSPEPAEAIREKIEARYSNIPASRECAVEVDDWVRRWLEDFKRKPEVEDAYRRVLQYNFDGENVAAACRTIQKKCDALGYTSEKAFYNGYFPWRNNTAIQEFCYAVLSRDFASAARWYKFLPLDVREKYEIA